MQPMDLILRWPSAAATLGEIDLIRYALRSVATYCAWAQRVVLVTPRPERPAWLAPDHPGLALVHHDEIMAQFLLPSGNPSSVDSHLHRVPGVGATFAVMPANTLILSPNIAQALMTPDGQAVIHLDAARRLTVSETVSVGALNKRFGRGDWPALAAAPVILDRTTTQAMCNDFAAQIAATRRNRSPRAQSGDVAPLFLAAHYAHATGRAIPGAPSETAQVTTSFEIGARYGTWWRLRQLARQHPMSVSFSRGNTASDRAVQIAQDWLERAFPDPAPWEI